VAFIAVGLVMWYVWRLCNTYNMDSTISSNQSIAMTTLHSNGPLTRVWLSRSKEKVPELI